MYIAHRFIAQKSTQSESGECKWRGLFYEETATPPLHIK